MKFKDLTKSDIEYLRARYRSGLPRRVVQSELADAYGVHRRTIRKWAKRLEVGVQVQNVTNPRILIYDIETPRLLAELWWSGKQYVNGRDIHGEPRIISISWKWVGEDKVHAANWDLVKQTDRAMMEQFMEEYNSADIVVGVNNNNFDNRWINARAMKHKLPLNTFVRSVDLQKQVKKLCRLPSYALAYLCEFFDLPTQKLGHEGITMWRKIQYGDMTERGEYITKMIEYNVGDILATEALFLFLLPYLNLQAHLGTMEGNPAYSCPMCGETEEIELFKTTSTSAGTIQHVMRCKKDGHIYKISNANYVKWFTGK